MTLHAVIIGAGSTGAALAHDLVLRDYRVTVVERGEVACETTGRNHGLFHSGARYAVTDPPAAKECAIDNALLRRLMTGMFELNGGLFVALSEEDLLFQESFLEGCAAAGIPTQVLSPGQALALEPNLNPHLLAAVLVPDGVFDPFHFALAFLATAKKGGATVHTYTEVIGLQCSGHSVTGVRLRDRVQVEERIIGADLVINAAGPWAGEIARMAGLEMEVIPMAGVMVAVAQRWTRRVINRLCPPCDGGILVPQRRTSVIGTTSWQVDDPDMIPIPPAQVEAMLAAAADFVPDFRSAPVRGVSAAARPLVKGESGLEDVHGRAISRGFECVDHCEDQMEGFFSLIGGKTTTSRYMAEVMTDKIVAATGEGGPCRTRETPLVPYHTYYD